MKFQSMMPDQLSGSLSLHALTKTTPLADIADADLRELLASWYADTARPWVASILNACYTQRVTVFSLGPTSLEKLLADDVNLSPKLDTKAVRKQSDGFLKTMGACFFKGCKGGSSSTRCASGYELTGAFSEYREWLCNEFGLDHEQQKAAFIMTSNARSGKPIPDQSPSNPEHTTTTPVKKDYAYYNQHQDELKERIAQIQAIVFHERSDDERKELINLEAYAAGVIAKKPVPAPIPLPSGPDPRSGVTVSEGEGDDELDMDRLKSEDSYLHWKVSSGRKLTGEDVAALTRYRAS